MDVTIQKKELGLEYLTQKFMHTFEVTVRGKYDESIGGWKNYTATRETPTQIGAQLSLLERELLPTSPDSTSKPVKYWITVYYVDKLNPDGTDKGLHSYPMSSISSPRRTACDTDIGYEIEAEVRTKFPLHNVKLEIIVYSALNSVVGDYDREDVFRPLIKPFVENVIQQGLQEVNTKSREDRS